MLTIRFEVQLRGCHYGPGAGEFPQLLQVWALATLKQNQWKVKNELTVDKRKEGGGGGGEEFDECT